MSQLLLAAVDCTVKENDSGKPQMSNVQAMKPHNVSEKTKINRTYQPYTSALGSKLVKDQTNIGIVVSSSTNTDQSSITNNHIQHGTNKTFDSTELETENNTTRWTKKHYSGDEKYSQPKKFMKTSTSSQNLQNLFQEENLSNESTEEERTPCKTQERKSKAQNIQRKTKKCSMATKHSNVAVPPHINQYGDFLKTKTGKLLYGVTLTDPPCQFFRGVLKDSSGETLAVMFGDTALFSKLEMFPKDKIGHFAIDTTYRVIPDSTKGVKNVLAIILLFENKVIPVWYAVTSSSSPELYKRIILEFQQYVLDWPIISILLSNDSDLVKAVNTIFPNVEKYGSWYHYCLSIWNEIRANKLVEECKSNEVLMKALKMLMVIPFLPPPNYIYASFTMLEGLEVVEEFAKKQSLPKNFQEVLSYIHSFWIHTVEGDNCSLYNERMMHISKYIEMFQVGLLSFQKPAGSIWTLTNQFRKYSKEVYVDVVRYLSGKPFVAKKCPRRKQISILPHENYKRLLKDKCDMETYLTNLLSYCNEFFDIVLHPLYPTNPIEKNINEHVQGWKIK